MNANHKQKVFKVVWRDGRKLYSTYAPIKFRRTYRVGSTTYPVKGTKLFCFPTFEDAKQYAGNYIQCHIYEAEASGVRLGGWIENEVYDIECLRAYFTSAGFYKNGTWNLKYKTATCESLKLIKRLI